MRILFAVLLASFGIAHAAEFTGWLADAKCASAGKAAAAAHSACAQKCVEGGQPIVLVGEDKKIYKIKNQEKVKPHLGHHVVVEATLSGDELQVDKGRYID
jgi:hypothetical protein